MIEHRIHSEGQQKAFVDIDETICFYKGPRIYEKARPNKTNINKINKLKKLGWHITYYTARGGHTKKDLYQFTFDQLTKWGCLFDDLVVGYREDITLPVKPSYDLIIDDKAKRIEEL
jgi:hypothetical protein|tara:strand:- start:612 stop:962 length:351 start_codon:yes stop_codon:yes gene_type:complete